MKVARARARSCAPQSVLLVLGLTACPAPVVPDNQPTPTTSSSNVGPPIPESVKPERLTNGPTDEFGPIVRADGSTLFFYAEAKVGDPPDVKIGSQVVYALKLGRPYEEKVAFTAEQRFSNHPGLSRDGQTMVFVTNATGPLAIVRAPAEPNAPMTVVVTSAVAPELAEPAISPDGARIAFSMRDTAGRAIAIVDADGKNFTRVTEGRSPAWSPDGTRLAFVRSTAAGFIHLFTTDVATFRDEKQLTDGELDCDSPAFSPDGRSIVVASNLGWRNAKRDRSEELHLFTLPATGGSMSPLTSGGGRAAMPFWASDGYVYFASDREGSFDVYRIKPVSGAG